MRYTYPKKLLWLFFINLLISAFTFGGGYVVIPMIRKYFVLQKKMFAEEELMEMAAIAQSSPGAIAVNLSSLAGFRVAGFTGAMVSCVAAVLPALVILSLVSAWYGAFADNIAVAAVLKGMEAGVAAVIVSLVLDMYKTVLSEKNRLLCLLPPAVFLGNFFWGLPVALLLLSCCIICLIPVWINKKRRTQDESYHI